MLSPQICHHADRCKHAQYAEKDTDTEIRIKAV